MLCQIFLKLLVECHRDPFLTLLFIIYINDIVNVSTILKYVLFADDTNLLASHENLAKLIENINQEIIKVVNWLNIDKLSLNIKNSLHFIL